MMGTGENDGGARSEERPQHEVKLSAFLLQTTAVTVAQYRLFDSATQMSGHGRLSGDDCQLV
jgi:formylglycine-generating enzyme required for sulfatase activity